MRGRFLRAAAGRRVSGGGEDADAAVYIAAVEAADGQALEGGVRQAINDFVTALKDGGYWDSLVFAFCYGAARTINGCLVPLVGNAPTNVGFTDLDVSRGHGIAGRDDGVVNVPRIQHAYTNFTASPNAATDGVHIFVDVDNYVVPAGNRRMFAGERAEMGCWTRGNGTVAFSAAVRTVLDGGSFASGQSGVFAASVQGASSGNWEALSLSGTFTAASYSFNNSVPRCTFTGGHEVAASGALPNESTIFYESQGRSIPSNNIAGYKALVANLKDSIAAAVT